MRTAWRRRITSWCRRGGDRRAVDHRTRQDGRREEPLPHRALLWMGTRVAGAPRSSPGSRCCGWYPRCSAVPFDGVGDALRSGGYGLLALVATPIIAVLACVTVIGIPVGLIALMAWCAGIYLAKVVVAQLIGVAPARCGGRARGALCGIAAGRAVDPDVRQQPAVRRRPSSDSSSRWWGSACSCCSCTT